MIYNKRKTSQQKSYGAQLAAIVGVLLLIGAVLILKAQKSAVSSANSQDEVGLASPAAQPSPTRTLLSEAQTAAPAQPPPAPTLLPEAQLDQLLAAGKPTLAFFHSNTCKKCIRMSEIVEEVYPDFADTVSLVDVNAYEGRNASLLQRVGIRAIPTLIFIDRTGQGRSYMGVMEPDELREQLRALGGE